MASREQSLHQTLRLAQGPVDLTELDTEATPGFAGSKSEGKQALAELGERLADLQERLFAHGRSGGRRSVLVVLQGMDTSGKGGTMRNVASLMDPQGVRIKAFGSPTREELAHDFLWRINKEVPAAGTISLFDRSHYEDVLVTRVRGLVPAARVERRYDAINAFEHRLVDEGTAVLKCMLHISPAEQRSRLLARLDRPEKHWKFDPGDVDDRALWPAYREAYEIALERCNTDASPWHVIPADRKWYRNWAVATLLLEVLEDLDLDWPRAEFDVGEQRRRLLDLGLES